MLKSQIVIPYDSDTANDKRHKTQFLRFQKPYRLRMVFPGGLHSLIW